MKCFYTSKVSPEVLKPILSLPNVEEASCLSVVQSQLKTQTLGQTILYASELHSTQNILNEECRSAPEGTICWASIQTKGRGRGSNAWSSPSGCLMFSFRSHFYNGNQLPFVQYLVSLAVIQAIERSAGRKLDDLFQIKWPNDIYGKRQKIGGILCQSDYMNGCFRVTTGLGLNVDNAQPTICVNQILNEAFGVSVSTTEILTNFCNIFEPMQQVFNQSGFEPFQEEYVKRWMHSGQVVTLKDDTVDLQVRIDGLSTSGCLLATDVETAVSYELYPDGNSFDFFKGLLKRKL